MYGTFIFNIISGAFGGCYVVSLLVHINSVVVSELQDDVTRQAAACVKMTDTNTQTGRGNTERRLLFLFFHHLLKLISLISSL